MKRIILLGTVSILILPSVMAAAVFNSAALDLALLVILSFVVFAIAKKLLSK